MVDNIFALIGEPNLLSSIAHYTRAVESHLSYSVGDLQRLLQQVLPAQQSNLKRIKPRAGDPEIAPFLSVGAYNCPTTRKALISKFEKILTS
ncbi:MAG: hypothetical protein JSW47_17375 [Phycisphaerales bacterium]|nr:MAG: hypothetical protein JSW47_17375 [Phycisphaerales bacterium]